jgi:hypothetical protein
VLGAQAEVVPLVFEFVEDYPPPQERAVCFHGASVGNLSLRSFSTLALINCWE